MAKDTGTDAVRDGWAEESGGRLSILSAEGLNTWLGQVANLLRGTSIDLHPYTPSKHGPLLDFEANPSEQEVDRYWLNLPYAMAVITFDTEVLEHQYHVVEPDLDPLEEELLSRLREDVREPILYREDSSDAPDDVIKEELRKRLEEFGLDTELETFYKLYYYLRRDFRGYGKIDPLMHDPHIEDISCNGYDLQLFVYHDDYTDIETNISFTTGSLDRFTIQLAQQAGQHISAGDPIVETTLPDGSRAELSLGEQITPRGSAFTIRRYAVNPMTPVDLIDFGTFSVEQMAYLWLAIENNKNLIFAGGTASGKTTSMNAISMFIPPRSKIVTIEDTRELTLHHDNWLSSVTRERIGEEEDVTMFDLLRAGLRHRPEYIVVGEIRGEEALTLFQAMNTGHTTYSTMHADSVQTVINRLENEPINVPRQMIQALDILCTQQLTRINEERVRRNRKIVEINDLDSRSGDMRYSEKYEWRPQEDTFSDMLGTSRVMQEIQEERGWSQNDLNIELRNRQQVLQSLLDSEVTNYRHFTAMVNEYYTNPGKVMDAVVDGLAPATD